MPVLAEPRPPSRGERRFTAAVAAGPLPGAAAAVRGGLFVLVARAGIQGLQLLVLLWLARLLPPREFGLVALITAVLGAGQLVQDLGLSAATVQRPDLRHGEASTLFWITVALSALLSLLGLLLAPLLAAFYQEPSITPLALALALGFLLGGAGAQHRALLLRQQRHRRLALIGLLSTAAGCLSALWLAHQGAGAWALVAQQLVGGLLATVLLWQASPLSPDRFQISPAVREMLRFGGHFLGFRLLGYGAHNLQVVLVGRELGAASAALFTRAYWLAQQALGYANDTAGQLAQAALPRRLEDPAAFERYYLRSLHAVLLATAPLAALCLGYGDRLIGLLFGPAWGASGELLRILAVGMWVQPVLYSTGWLYTARGETRALLRWGLFGWTVMILASLIGLQQGLPGLAWAWSLGQWALLLPGCALAWRGPGIRPSAVLAVAAPPLLAALLALALSWPLLPDPGRASPALGLLPVLGVFALVYPAAVLVWPGQRPLILPLLAAVWPRHPLSASRS
ncbi:MAG TPA: oligosaccharide flippase family protein [Nevskiaceae bacterium]|nr:oligosaccharide flippase family protein [Nevskiaceae bacterium]